MKSENMKQRKLYGVPMIPFGLLAGFVSEKEVRITELSEEGFAFRTAEQIQKPDCVRLCFYNLEKAQYEELILQGLELEQGEIQSFFHTYTIWMDQQQSASKYRELVRKLLGQYSHYIQLKLTEDDGGLAQAMTGYPAELDEIHAETWEQQKKLWYAEAYTDRKEISLPEYAIALDRPELYEQYLHQELKKFVKNYWQEQQLENCFWSAYMPNRLYVGNQFCSFLFPEETTLREILEKAERENLQITVVCSCIRELMMPITMQLMKKLDQWCEQHGQELEVVVNDWGLAKGLKETTIHLHSCMGTLLNKYKKDPRMKYKQGDPRLLRENNLFLKEYREYLVSEYGIYRYEWESCGCERTCPQGNNSLHFPFYQTNTSQYCPLYASCTTGQRGRQKLPVNCPQYCRKLIFLYPDHLKMVGRYNSLFALDDTLLRMPEQAEQLMKSGIDRLVVNLL